MLVKSIPKVFSLSVATNAYSTFINVKTKSMANRNIQ